MKAKVLIVTEDDDLIFYTRKGLMEMSCVESVRDCTPENAVNDIITHSVTAVVMDMRYKAEANRLIAYCRSKITNPPYFLAVFERGKPSDFAHSLSVGAEHYIVEQYTTEHIKEWVWNVSQVNYGKYFKYYSPCPALDNRIKGLLTKAKFSKKHSGTRYLHSILLTTVEQPYLLNGMMIYLYRKIAAENNKPDFGIERAIRYAIKHAWDKGNLKHVMEMFGLPITIKNEWPSAIELVGFLTQQLIREKKNFRFNFYPKPTDQKYLPD